MTKSKVILGIICCFLIIGTQLIGILLFYTDYGNKIFSSILSNIYLTCQTIIFITLWNIIVKHFHLNKYDIVLKFVIVTLIIRLLVYQLNNFKVFDFNLIVVSIITFSSLIGFFVFFYKILNTDRIEFKYIDSLKYFSISYLLCVLGQVLLSILVEFNYQHISFMNQLFVIIPIVFILAFFVKLKNSELKNAST